MPRRVRARGGTKTTKVTVVEKDGKRRTKTKPRAQSGRSHPAKNRRAKPRERQHQSGGGQAEPIALPSVYASAGTIGRKPPSEKPLKHGGSLVAGTELLCAVSVGRAQDGCELYGVVVNPRYWTGTRLALRSQLYTNFVVKRLRMHWTPSVGTSTGGSFVAGFRYSMDRAMPAQSFAGLQELSATEGVYQGPYWEPAHFDYNPAYATGPQPFELDPGTSASLDDPRFNAPAYFYLRSFDVLSTAGALGHLWLEYEVEFFTPTLQPSVVTSATYGGYDMYIEKAATGGGLTAACYGNAIIDLLAVNGITAAQGDFCMLEWSQFQDHLDGDAYTTAEPSNQLVAMASAGNGYTVNWPSMTPAYVWLTDDVIAGAAFPLFTSADYALADPDQSPVQDNPGYQCYGLTVVGAPVAGTVYATLRLNVTRLANIPFNSTTAPPGSSKAWHVRAQRSQLKTRLLRSITRAPAAKTTDHEEDGVWLPSQTTPKTLPPVAAGVYETNSGGLTSALAGGMQTISEASSIAESLIGLIGLL